jgi:hypothetical protein
VVSQGTTPFSFYLLHISIKLIMTQEEFDRISNVSQEIVKLANELISKLEMNQATIEERRISNAATSTVINEMSNLMNELLTEISSDDAPPDQKLARVKEFLTSLISSLQSSQRSSEHELIRLTATQDGMRRALEAVRDTGNLRIQELARIEILANTENPESRRSVGDRPETVATKRNAKSLKQDREGGNT